MNARLHAVVSGSVQGVFFRDFVHKTALRLGITGWVRNNPDGTVEFVAEGEKDRLEELLAECRKGPTAANVENIKAEWEKPTKAFGTFDVRY